MADTPAELAHRYAVALDLKDVGTLAGLFVPHLQAKLREQFEPVIARLGVTVLSVTTQVVDMDPADDDRATGTVYCTAEIDDPDYGWIRQSIVYLDRYERVDGQWYFKPRDHQLVYGLSLSERPLIQDPANWPERPIGRGTYPPT